MSQMTQFVRTGGTLLALCAAFAGCSSRTNVSATGATPTQFTHVFITAQAVWFNTNKGANPDDSGWAKFVLKTPVTIDLIQQSNGTLGELARDLRLAPGTYNSILLLPVDPTSDTPTASAQALSANFNQEADFVDANGVTQQVKLILPNWEKGIIAPGTLKVPVGKPTTTGIGTTNNGTTNSALTLFGSPTTINPNTSNTTNTNTFNSTTTNTGTNTTTNTTNNTSNTTTVSFGVNFEGNRDLHMFKFPLGAASPLTGVLLSASPTATDLSTTGGITGTLTLTSITNVTSNPSIANSGSSRTAIQASAELLSADGTHHVIVASAPVQSDGTFTIYPLTSNSRTPTAYDVVIHGGNIATIIIKNVSVATTTPNITAAASTAYSVATTTASGAVSLGTLIPRAAGSFVVNLSSTAGANLPPGSALAFYQTLPAANEVPYAIDEVGIDPVNFTLVVPETLGTNSIDSGTYSSNGGTITLTSSIPAEKLGTYEVGATAPLYTDSVPSGSITVMGPASAIPAPTGTATSPTAITTPAQLITTTLPALTPANGAAASITAAITDSQGDTQGTLLVSHDGALIGTADLSRVLPNGGNVTVNGLPSGNVYFLSVIVSRGGALQYESIAEPVNLSSGSATNVAVAIN